MITKTKRETIKKTETAKARQVKTKTKQLQWVYYDYDYKDRTNEDMTRQNETIQLSQ